MRAKEYEVYVILRVESLYHRGDISNISSELPSLSLLFSRRSIARGSQTLAFRSFLLKFQKEERNKCHSLLLWTVEMKNTRQKVSILLMIVGVTDPDSAITVNLSRTKVMMIFID